MNLYCLANIGRSMVLSVRGDWISIKGTKNNLRNVCWFQNAADAQKYTVMYAPRNVSVVSAKTLRKKMGLKHLPGYVAENYSSSVLSRMFKEEAAGNKADVEDISKGDSSGMVEMKVVKGTEEKKGNNAAEPRKIPVIPAEQPSLELRVEDDTMNTSSIVAEIQTVLDMISEAPERWTQLQEQLQERLRQMELRELDLLHIIEFYLPDEETIIRLYRALHDLRIARRQVKNELTALAAATKAAKSIPEASLAYALDGIEQIKNQRYKCRTFPEHAPEWLQTLLREESEIK